LSGETLSAAFRFSGEKKRTSLFPFPTTTQTCQNVWLMKRAHAFVPRPRRYSLDSHLAPPPQGYSPGDMEQLDQMISAKITAPRAPLPRPEHPGAVLRRLARAERD
jgi:hypothetical protein